MLNMRVIFSLSCLDLSFKSIGIFTLNSLEVKAPGVLFPSTFNFGLVFFLLSNGFLLTVLFFFLPNN